jgi:RNA 3'-terminal phosphate cyclase (GTP)
MIVIDGAIGYGQVLRTAVALSALTLKPIRIFNIRKGRSKPGLMPQHLAGVKAAGEFCNAEIKGLGIGSTEIEFVPKELNITDRKIDIGTAGQISLLLQTLTPLLIFSDNPVNLEIIGGTAGLGAPTMQFVKHVTFPNLSKLGVPIERDGFYPRGGGVVKTKNFPAKNLKSIKLLERGELKAIKGISVAGSLPMHVAERQIGSATKIFKDHGFDVIQIESKMIETFSPGTSITLWAETESSVIGADALGERGKPAEEVGKEAASELVKSIESKSALDKYTGDQILPFLALAQGYSEITVEEITQHCKTNIAVCEQILGVKFDVDEKMKMIGVEGINYS